MGLHCVGDPGIVAEIMLALPTTHIHYTAIV